MKTITEIAALIAIRNHLWSALNGPRNLIAKPDVAVINALAIKLDKEILSASIETLKDESNPLPKEDVDVQAKITAAKEALKSRKLKSPDSKNTMELKEIKSKE